MFKKFTLLDYKGKHFVIQDKNYELEYLDYPIGSISKREALKPKFIKRHKANCRHYGIPCYFGKDKDMLKAFE